MKQKSKRRNHVKTIRDKVFDEERALYGIEGYEKLTFSVIPADLGE